MKHWITWVRQRGAGRHFAEGLMLSLWIAVLALAASPQLHRLLHQDANDLGHHCLISQLKQHLLLAGLAPAVTAVAPTAVAELISDTGSQFLPARDYRFALSRAPPATIPTLQVAGGAAG